MFNALVFRDLRFKYLVTSFFYYSEFLTWVDEGRTKGILAKDTCDYGKLVSDFVSASCVPGTKSDDHAVTSGTDLDKLCSNCQSSASPLSKCSYTYFAPDFYLLFFIAAQNCNADNTNNYYGSEGALKCLSEIGQFAVITKHSKLIYFLERN